MIKSSSTIAIFRTSLLCLALVYLSYGQSFNDVAGTSVISALKHPNVVNELTARIGEESFWAGIQLPTRNLRAIVYEAQSPQVSGSVDFDALVIVPEIDATYQYRLCGKKIIPVNRTEEWLTWRYADSARINADEYMRQQESQFGNFISRAKRSDETLKVGSGPDALFRIDSKLKTARLSEIEKAAGNLFHKRPLRLTVADFSATTEQINALVPALGKMVTFSVTQSCTAEDRVEVGREVPLKSIRSDLRARIETNSTTLTMK